MTSMAANGSSAVPEEVSYPRPDFAQMIPFKVEFHDLGTFLMILSVYYSCLICDFDQDFAQTIPFKVEFHDLGTFLMILSVFYSCLICDFD